MTPIYEAMSAMQKSIRRNDLEKAYYFALKVEEFNPKMLWNRLQIIVSEDIGPANPNLPMTFEIIKKWYFDDLNKGSTGQLFLSHMIALMASGPKSRDADNLIYAVKKKMHYEGDYITIPDYAFDEHTLKGKMMGRGTDYFYKESAKLAEDQSNQEILKILMENLKKGYKTPKEGFPQTRKVMMAWNRMKPKGTAKENNPNVNTPKVTQTSLDAGFYDDGDPAEQ